MRRGTSHLTALLHWLGDFESSERKVTSQNGEDGVLLHLIDFLGSGAKTYVEFGVQDASESNTRWLRESHGWSGLLMDGGYQNDSINLRKEFITTNNVASLLSKHGFAADRPLDILSIDTDCFDFWITRALLDAGYRPRILINEINTAVQIAPPVAISVPHPADMRSSHFFTKGYDAKSLYTATCWDNSGVGVSAFMGASTSAFWRLYRAYGYSMVYCESKGANCFGVRDDLVAMSPSDFLKDHHVYRVPHLTKKHCGFYKPAKKRKWVHVCSPHCNESFGPEHPGPTW